MGYKRKYTKSGEGAVASYDFTELLSGLGVERFYAIATSSDTVGGTTYMLSTNATNIYTDVTSTQTTTTTTVNFDTSEFNIPRIVNGTAVVNFVAVNLVASSTNCTFSAQLKKVAADSTVSNLTSAFVLDHDANSAPGAVMNANAKENVLFFMPVTRTKMAIGDKIRLTIIVTDLDAENIGVYHDPLGRDLLSDTNYSTQMKVDIPFEIEL